MIDTQVLGDPHDVRGAAGWLRGSLVPAIDEAGRRTAAALEHSRGSWEGETADAYRERAREVRDHLAFHSQQVAATASLLEAYAVRMEACQQAMATLRSEAAAEGFHVDHRWIGHGAPPTPDTTAAEQQRRAAAYADLRRRVVAEHEAWAAWVHAHMFAHPVDQGRAGAVRGLMASMAGSMPVDVDVGRLLAGTAAGVSSQRADRIADGLARVRADVSPRGGPKGTDRIAATAGKLVRHGGGLLSWGWAAHDIFVDDAPEAETIAATAASTVTSTAVIAGGLAALGPGAPIATTVAVVGGGTVLGSAATGPARQAARKLPPVRRKRELDR